MRKFLVLIFLVSFSANAVEDVARPITHVGMSGEFRGLSYKASLEVSSVEISTYPHRVHYKLEGVSFELGGKEIQIPKIDFKPVTYIDLGQVFVLGSANDILYLQLPVSPDDRSYVRLVFQHGEYKGTIEHLYSVEHKNKTKGVKWYQ
ncbi:hypothetical protein [Microbulbifer sp. ANSA005]|uniref:hypothetical protein n=1 Tax=unclassified Microbulbifer TaxID=2619833 RepID=UPI004043102C